MENDILEILIVDDDEVALSTMTEKVKLFGDRFNVTVNIYSFNNVKDASKCLENNQIDIAILDYMMPQKTGIEFSKHIKDEKYEVKIMLASGFDPSITSALAIEHNLDEFLIKPPELNDLHFKIYRLYKELILEKKITILSDKDKFVTKDENTIAMLKKIPVLSESDITILITGESGTGKELIAEMIHKSSPRRDKIFIPINCSALPENLLESELFGYEKGAFTGASKSYQGIFRIADGGTVFLDEIGDMPISSQAKLLRVLENKEVRPIGSSKTYHIDTRIIAATNRQLDIEAKNENFRSDLYYRLQAAELSIPPLRSRKDDIEHLANHFLEVYSMKYNKPKKRICENILNEMKSYSWFGNVRELKNKLEQAFILCSDDCIERLYLKTDTQKLNSHDSSLDKKEDDVCIAYSDAKELFEKDYIINIMKQCKGNIRQASKLSDRDRKWVYNQIEKYGINPDDYRN